VLRTQGQNLHDASDFAPTKSVDPSNPDDVSDVKHAFLLVLNPIKKTGYVFVKKMLKSFCDRAAVASSGWSSHLVR
jgi:hypothetical protein